MSFTPPLQALQNIAFCKMAFDKTACSSSKAHFSRLFDWLYDFYDQEAHPVRGGAQKRLSSRLYRLSAVDSLP
jgi:hypothetical protein